MHHNSNVMFQREGLVINLTFFCNFNIFYSNHASILAMKKHVCIWLKRENEKWEIHFDLLVPFFPTVISYSWFRNHICIVICTSAQAILERREGDYHDKHTMKQEKTRVGREFTQTTHKSNFICITWEFQNIFRKEKKTLKMFSFVLESA